MKRKIYDKIIEWKSSKNRKPLLMFGARQVGKTYIIREFCKMNMKIFMKLIYFTMNILLIFMNLK